MIHRHFGGLMLAASVASCATPADFGAAFGVVDQSEGRVPCAVFSSPGKVGERVRIVAFAPDRRIDARLAKKVDACGVGLEPGHAYELEFTEQQEGLFASVAVRGTLPFDTTFRQCSGTESIHLTAWRGGARIWHGYYYLGYDVEPDCKSSDIE